jgi:hypothetical protein
MLNFKKNPPQYIHGKGYSPGLPDFAWHNIPKRDKHKLYQMAIKSLMAIKIPKGYQI